MKLQDLWKKKETTERQTEMFVNGAEDQERKKVLVIGSDCCTSGKKLYQIMIELAKEMDASVEISYTDALDAGIEYGVITRPAIVCGGKVYSFGKSVDTDELTAILRD